MLVIPAIDIKKGRCVRLVEGREDSVKVYEGDPTEVALQYQQAGATLIHVVDLDGAFLGARSDNRKIIREMTQRLDIPIEVGGGVRSFTDIESLLEEAGARYAIVGTLAVERPELVRLAVAKFGDRVIVGVDARGDQVATRGWTEATKVGVTELARQAADLGVRRVIYTDIARDGRLEGPNFEMTRRIAVESGLRVTASGGVSSLEDITHLCSLESDGVDAVIVGKALYEGRFSVEQAIALTLEQRAGR
jgi:phosphoribosylformimino-5-aminoimidazole carboxamide ribotide isomerase